MPHWSRDAFIYHLYPLGWGGAPARNDFASPPVPRLAALHGWLDHLQGLGVDTLLLGWGQNDDNLHGPDEKFSLADFHRGIKASAHLLAELA